MKIRRPPSISEHYWIRLVSKANRIRYRHLLGLEYGRTLDVGCGLGYFSLLLARRGVDLTCVDIDSGMLAKASDLFAAHDTSIRFICTDVVELDLEPFDTVMCLETLEHIEDWRAVLAKCMDLTKRDLYVTVPAKGAMLDTIGHIHDFDPEDIVAEMQGFDVCLEVEWPFSYILGRRYGT